MLIKIYCFLPVEHVETSKAYQLVNERVGSYDDICCTQRFSKLFNVYERIDQRNVNMFIDKFRRNHKMKHSFFYDYESDSEGKLKYVFWIYCICRIITLCLEM